MLDELGGISGARGFKEESRLSSFGFPHDVTMIESSMNSEKELKTSNDELASGSLKKNALASTYSNPAIYPRPAPSIQPMHLPPRISPHMYMPTHPSSRSHKPPNQRMLTSSANSIC
jgi:hypothetical protein